MFNVPSHCNLDTTNNNWLIPVASLDKIEFPDNNHAYILPNNSIWVLSHDGKEFIELNESGSSENKPTEIKNEDGSLVITDSGTFDVTIDVDLEKVKELTGINQINESLSLKQEKLTASDGIKIDDETNKISATGQNKKVTLDSGNALFKAGDNDTILAHINEIKAGAYTGEATGVTSDSPNANNVRLIVNMVTDTSGSVIAIDSQGNGFIRPISGSSWREDWRELADNNNIKSLSLDFEGYDISVTKASSVENSTQVWYRANVSDIALNGVNIHTRFRLFSEDSNISYLKTAYFASSSPTSITNNGTTTTRHNSTTVERGFTDYDDSFISTLSDNLYLHVLIRVSEIDPNKSTNYKVSNPVVLLNDTELPLEFVGIHSIGSPIVTSRKLDDSDRAFLTGDVLNQLFETVVFKRNNREGYIYFTVDVNQKFDNNIDISPDIQDFEEYKPVDCVLKLPDNYSATGIPVPLVMWAHGAGGKVTATDPGEMSRAVPYLSSKGYALFDVNGSNNDYIEHADHMGSPRALSAYLKAYEYIIKHYNVEPRLFVHGHSMGGLLALNFASQNKDIVKVLGLAHPVTDLYNQAWLKPWFGIDTKKQIAKEFNFDDQTGATYESEKTIGFNPIKNDAITTVDQDNIIIPAPIKIWHGDADNVVDISGSQKYITASKQAGGRASLRTLSGVAHTVTATMFEEIGLWFDRFK